MPIQNDVPTPFHLLHKEFAFWSGGHQLVLSQCIQGSSNVLVMLQNEISHAEFWFAFRSNQQIINVSVGHITHCVQ